jgi:hypothetical protein
MLRLLVDQLVGDWIVAFGEICSRFLRWRSIYIHEVLCLEMRGWLDSDFQIQEHEGGEWLDGRLFPRWHVLCGGVEPVNPYRQLLFLCFNDLILDRRVLNGSASGCEDAG